MNHGITIGGKTYYTICVHDHRFHSDDVFSVALLESLYLESITTAENLQYGARIASSVRSAVLPHQLPLPVLRVSSNNEPTFFENLEATGVLCIDVGKGRYDHHQLDARTHMSGEAYCGLSLVWEQILQDGLYITSEMRQFASLIEKDIIYAIEDADNGRRPCVLSHLVEFRNPLQPQNGDIAFVDAVRLAMKIIKPFLAQMTRDARELNELLTESAYLQTAALATRRIALAPKSYRPRILTAAFPWANAVLYPDKRGEKFTYALRSIDDVSEDGANHNRWLVPEEFRDKTVWPKEFGVKKEPIFVHPNGFLATFDTLSTVAMALLDDRMMVATDWGAARENLPAARIPKITTLRDAKQAVPVDQSMGMHTRVLLENTFADLMK